jgi:hypothetical protein
MRYLVREYEVGRIRFKYTRVSDEQTDEELRARLQDYEQRLLESKRKELRDISVLEFANSNQYSPQQRRIQSEWNSEHDELLREVELSLIFVTPSQLMRGVITAVFWGAPPPFPYEVCEDVHEALARAFEICTLQGMRVDDIVRDHIRVCLFN